MVLSEELHEPPVVASVSVIIAPTQTELDPPIEAGAAGVEITLTATVTELVPQALETEYVTGAVPRPAVVMFPLPSIFTILVLPLVHEPPEVASVKVVAEPEQTVVVPEIGDGAAGTVLTVIG